MRSALATLVLLAGCRQLLGLDRPTHEGADAGPADAALDAALLAPDAQRPGSITVTAATLNPGDIDLTSEGTTDWAHWGLSGATSFDHKASFSSSISNATTTGGASTVMAITNVAVTASWTDGTPDATATASGTAIGVTTGGLEIQVPADPFPRMLHVYIGGRAAQGRIDVALSDSSAAPYTDDQFTSATVFHSEYTIVYSAATASAQLDVTWSFEAADGAGGFVSLLSATLP